MTEKRDMRLRHLAVLLGLAGAIVVPVASAATGDASFALRPVKFDPKLPITRSYYVLTVHPGETIHEQVSVVNAGGSAGTAYIYPVDATTGQTSGAVYLSRISPRHDVGSWITLSLVPVAHCRWPYQSLGTNRSPLRARRFQISFHGWDGRRLADYL